MKEKTENYRKIEDLNDEEVYQLMDNSDFITAYVGEENYSAQFAALDPLQRIVAVGTEPRAEAKAIMRGCISPRVLNLGYFNKDKLLKHNKQLQKNLEITLNRKIKIKEILFPYEHTIKNVNLH